MKIAFTAKGIEWESRIDPRFGRTEYLFIYDDELDSISTYDNRGIAMEAHGAGPKTAQKMIEIGADILITGNGPGGNATSVFGHAEINVFTGAGDMTIKEAYDAFCAGDLTKF